MWNGNNRPAEDTPHSLGKEEEEKTEREGSAKTCWKSMVSFGASGGVMRENRCGCSFIGNLFCIIREGEGS